ncbi:hypothetical protein P43SY_010951 [Pythium insidiosum]|uniref:Reverse transcriptase RNase H-like domain-containing protein n=1 Tax=Pythium insidiosum TaxID=114742 RepID=A0AAD5Q3H8_PYTIN|nr:hypothetical protein P43SY_010951 [Pythium insidiosum]
MGSASTWAESYERATTPAQRTLDHFFQALRERYGTKLDEVEAVERLAATSKRVGETYAEYAAALRRLVEGVDIPEKNFVSAFLKGLSPTTGPLIRAQNPTDLNAAVYAAVLNMKHDGTRNGDQTEEVRQVEPARIYMEGGGGLPIAKMWAKGWPIDVILDTVYGQELVVDALLVEGCGNEFIVGSDFWTSKRATINYETAEVTYPEKGGQVIVPFSCVSAGSDPPVRIVPSRKLPTESQSMFRLRVPAASGDVGFFVPTPTTRAHLLMATTLTRVDQGEIVVPVLNVLENFGTKAEPLTRLLRKKEEWRWEDEQQVAFQTLKDELSNKPTLCYPDFEKPFVLATDASIKGLGAVLMQDQGQGLQPIGYASKVTNEQQSNYPITHLECLAVVWAIQHFRPYLYGREFEVVTDHAALKWLMTARELERRLHRWALTLQKYNFTVVYRPGKTNVVPDALSRAPVGTVERFNRTWKDMVSMYVEEDQRDWDEWLSLTAYAYNSAVNTVTGFTPMELLTGREPRAPRDLLLPGRREAIDDLPQWHRKMKARMLRAEALARELFVELAWKFVRNDSGRYEVRVLVEVLSGASLRAKQWMSFADYEKFWQENKDIEDDVEPGQGE